MTEDNKTTLIVSVAIVAFFGIMFGSLLASDNLTAQARTKRFNACVAQHNAAECALASK